MKRESIIRKLLPLSYNDLLPFLTAVVFVQSTSAASLTNFTEVYWGLNGYKLTVPDLQVDQSNNNFKVSWSPDSDYFLTTASDMSQSAQWTNAPSPVLNGSNMEVTVPTEHEQQFFRLDGPRFYIPIFEFAIFYNSALEFTWVAPLTINGNVHANGPIYTGISSASSLTFNSVVTTTETISKKALGGYTLANMIGPENFNGDPATVTNSYPLLMLPGGTNNTPTELHAILEMPPAGEDVNSQMGQLRYYNKAGMILVVSNTTVTGIIKSSANDVSPTIITSGTNTVTLIANFPFLSITNSFYDQRESKTNKVTQIDMLRLKKWATTNAVILTKHPSDNPFSILYVADQRTVNSEQLTVVRLVNGTNLPSFGAGAGVGFTVATPNPLYVLGNYNLLDSSDAATTNTANTVPASLIADALTILSSAWKDANSTASLFIRNSSTNVTINAAILAGIVYSTGTNSSTFSGGLHNFPRLLEDWSGHTLTLNASIVNLFPSLYATNQYQLPSSYYNAPYRQFDLDQNFKNPAKLPPGTPMVGLFLPVK